MDIRKQIEVLMIISPGPVLGGAEFYSAELAQGINTKTDIRCKVLYSHNTKCKEFLDSYSVPNQWIGDNIWKCAFNLAKQVKQYQPKFIHSNGYHSNYIITLFKLFCYPKLKNRVAIKFSCTEHGWIYSNFYEKLKTFFDNQTLRFFDSVGIVDPNMEKIIKKYKKDNIFYSPPFINTGNLFKSFRENFKFMINKDNRKKVVLGVGRLSPEKRFDLFLRSAYELYKINHNYYFIIVGEGSERKNLEILAKQLKISNNVQFVGFVDDMADYYLNADVLFICSDTEGCPRTALEAMFGKLLVVSREVGYMTTLLADRRGVLYPYNSSASHIAKTIDAMLQEQKREHYVDRAFSYVNNNHGLSRVVKVFSEIFK